MIEINHLVDEWIRVGLKTLHEEQFVQADLDELTTTWNRSTAARDSVDLLQRIAAETSDAPKGPLVFLTLPLRPTRRLTLAAPSLRRVLHSPWTQLQPPGFYLARRELWAAWTDGEEHRAVVDDAELLAEGLSCHFRVHRSAAARERGWEYDREFIIRRR